MRKQFWHDAVTEKSFIFLQDLRKNFKFTLIGGWAVYFYTKALKSKDIDIVVGFEELAKLRKSFALIKNDRLFKYEIKAEGFDVDIYVPHWSRLGIPAEFVLEHNVSIEGFRVPKLEILLALKLYVYRERQGSLKGQKDMMDIISLFYYQDVSVSVLHKILRARNLEYLADELTSIFKHTQQMPDLNLNRKQFADFKKRILTIEAGLR